METWGCSRVGDSGIGGRLGCFVGRRLEPGRRRGEWQLRWCGHWSPSLAPEGALDGKGVCWKVMSVSRVLGTL